MSTGLLIYVGAWFFIVLILTHYLAYRMGRIQKEWEIMERDMKEVTTAAKEQP